MECAQDDNPCTEHACNSSDGACHSQPLADGTSCSDGDACTLGDVCAAGVCSQGPDTVECENVDPCRFTLCNPANGRCELTNSPVPDGTPCSDNNPCTVGDQCREGVCFFGPDLECPQDGNPCSTQTCDPVDGSCVSATVDDGTTCDDGNPCSLGDSCQAGVCMQGQSSVDCPQDFDSCRFTQCNPDSGACELTTTALPDGTPCSDHNRCSLGDACQAGVCMQGSSSVHCPQDLDTCRFTQCNPENGLCELIPVAIPDGTACDLGEACADLGTCHGGACLCLCEAFETPCNGVDDDCDPSTPDNIVLRTVAACGSPGSACHQPEYELVMGCDDDPPACDPMAGALCEDVCLNGIDDDCDGQVDEVDSNGDPGCVGGPGREDYAQAGGSCFDDECNRTCFDDCVNNLRGAVLVDIDGDGQLNEDFIADCTALADPELEPLCQSCPGHLTCLGEVVLWDVQEIEGVVQVVGLAAKGRAQCEPAICHGETSCNPQGDELSLFAFQRCEQTECETGGPLPECHEIDPLLGLIPVVDGTPCGSDLGCVTDAICHGGECSVRTVVADGTPCLSHADTCVVGQCDAGVCAGGQELCADVCGNGFDDDCDGHVDETDVDPDNNGQGCVGSSELAGPGSSCFDASCNRTCVDNCIDNTFLGIAIDSDQDGLFHEDFDYSDYLARAPHDCEADNVPVCEVLLDSPQESPNQLGGFIQQVCAPGPPDVCDFDDAVCTPGIEGLAAGDVQICGPTCTPEVCNSLDDDGDGEIDEGLSDCGIGLSWAPFEVITGELLTLTVPGGFAYSEYTALCAIDSYITYADPDVSFRCDVTMNGPSAQFDIEVTHGRASDPENYGIGVSRIRGRALVIGLGANVWHSSAEFTAAVGDPGSAFPPEPAGRPAPTLAFPEIRVYDTAGSGDVYFTTEPLWSGWRIEVGGAAGSVSGVAHAFFLPPHLVQVNTELTALNGEHDETNLINFLGADLTGFGLLTDYLPNADDDFEIYTTIESTGSPEVVRITTHGARGNVNSGGTIRALILGD